MIKTISRKLGSAVIVGALIIGTGWSLTTQQGSEFLADGSAIFMKSWGDVFGANGAAQAQVVPVAANGDLPVESGALIDASGTAAAPSAKTKVTACWGTEQEDLAKLSGLLQNSNASLADLTAKLTPASGTCPDAIDGVPGLTAEASISADATSAVKNIIPAQCSVMAPEDDPSGQIILNEIAWMGSPAAPGESTTKTSNQEWIELKNISAKTITLNGWQVADAGWKVQVVFGAGDSIPAGGHYLLSRSGNPIGGVKADKAYSGALSNSGDILAVFDADCGVSDFLDASKGWPAGDNTTKQTMERHDGATWQTSTAPGGTPSTENSSGLAKYTVNIAIQGDGIGTIVSNPAGISCNSVAVASGAGASNCAAQFAAGTVLTLAAAPGKDTAFEGWSGGCSGAGKCALMVNGAISTNATFHASLSDAQSELLASAQDSTVPATSTPSSSVSITPTIGAGHILIAQVQIAGASSTNDFIKIYNPTANPVDMGGWKLRKKSSAGTDASVREFPNGISIPVGAYFSWANSAGDYAQLIDADTSSTATLAADNSVALFDVSGALVDSVAWGTGINQYVEGSPYPTNPAANQILQRSSTGDGIGAGGLLDTENNATDFSLR